MFHKIINGLLDFGAERVGFSQRMSMTVDLSSKFFTHTHLAHYLNTTRMCD